MTFSEALREEYQKGYDEGYREGYIEGQRKFVYVLVRDGSLSIENAATNLGVSEEEILAEVEMLGKTE